MTLSNTPLDDSPPKHGLATALAPDVVRRRFVINVASNVAYTVASMLLMIWYIPFLIRHLGVATYGMIPLANTIIMYMSIVTEGLNVAINRFLTIDLNRLDEVAANKTFNTAFIVSMGLVAVLLPLALAVAWVFPSILQVPAGLETQTRLLFTSLALAFFLNIISSNFQVSTIVLHRFELRNALKALTMTTRVGIVVILFNLLQAQLWQVGTGLVISAFVTCVGAWFLCHRLTPQLYIRWSAFDRSHLRQLFSFSIWSVVNRIGMLLFIGTDILIVNFFFGAEQTGRYGTLLLFPELLRTLVDTVSSVLSPAIMARYAVHDVEGMKRLASSAVKLLGIALALPIGLLVGFSQPLLHIWLGPDFQSLAILLTILVGHLSINLATLPLAYVLTSYNKVHIQGIFTLALGVLNVPLSIGLAHWCGLGVLGVAGATAIVLTVKNLFILSTYSSHVMNLRWCTFYPSLIVGALGTFGVSLSSYGLTQLWWPISWSTLGGMAAVVTGGYAMVALFVSLNRQDRQLLWNLLPKVR